MLIVPEFLSGPRGVLFRRSLVFSPHSNCSKIFYTLFPPCQGLSIFDIPIRTDINFANISACHSAMITPEHIDLLKQYFSTSQRFLLIFGREATFDQIASATALYLSLREHDKDVSLLTPELVRTEFASLVGIQDASQQLGNKNLQISFDYQEEMVDKVSYNIDEDSQKFHLVIQPKRGGKPLDTKTVEFSYTGADADVILTIGVGDLEDLEQLYTGYEDFYANTPLISLHSFETPFGTTKIATEGMASFSEVMSYVLQQTGMTIDGDIATNLLSGIEDATENFRSLSATADTFEIASQLLRTGARRIVKNKKEHASTNGFAEAFAKVGKALPSRMDQSSAIQNSGQGQKSKTKHQPKIMQPSSENLG
jgi:nanoRNase/pAp phosphatase (c-di-AMP/oligoRNAs hydrolase)